MMCCFYCCFGFINLQPQRLELSSPRRAGVLCGARRDSPVSLPQRDTAASPAPSSTGRSTGRTTTTAAAWCTSAAPASASSACRCGSASRTTAGPGRRLSVCVSTAATLLQPRRRSEDEGARRDRRAGSARPGCARSPLRFWLLCCFPPFFKFRCSSVFFVH